MKSNYTGGLCGCRREAPHRRCCWGSDPIVAENDSIDAFGFVFKRNRDAAGTTFNGVIDDVHRRGQGCIGECRYCMNNTSG